MVVALIIGAVVSFISAVGIAGGIAVKLVDKGDKNKNDEKSKPEDLQITSTEKNDSQGPDTGGTHEPKDADSKISEGTVETPSTFESNGENKNDENVKAENDSVVTSTEQDHNQGPVDEEPPEQEDDPKETPKQETAPEKIPEPTVECHPDLKVYTLHGDVAKANDRTKFDLRVSEDNQSYTYELKENVECVEIKFKKFITWSHDPKYFGIYYPKVVYYFLILKLIVIRINDDWSYTYKVETETTKLLHSIIRGRPSDLEPAPERIFYYEEEKVPVQESDLPKGTKVSGHTDIKVTTCTKTRGSKVDFKNDYTVYKDGNSFTYYFVDGVKCLKIEYKNTVAWSYDNNEYEKAYPKSVIFYQTVKILDVFFKSKWYYSYCFFGDRWVQTHKNVLMKPGSLKLLLKSILNINLPISPYWLNYFSGTKITTIKFLMVFKPGLSPIFKEIIEKLYNSKLCYDSFASITAEPDKVTRVLELLKDTSLTFDKAGLYTLISNPDLLMHLAEELKTVGFSMHVLLKKLISDPDKLKEFLKKMKELGYALNEAEVEKLSKNRDLLNYLNVSPPEESPAS